MDTKSVEEAILDWHRLGHREALPCAYVEKLDGYFRTRAEILYLTYHLKTIDYFENAPTQHKYWDMIDSLLTDLELTGENSVTQYIEKSARVRLTPKQRIEFGHILPVNIGYPLLNTHTMNVTIMHMMEYPNSILSSMHTIMLEVFFLRNQSILHSPCSSWRPNSHVLQVRDSAY